MITPIFADLTINTFAFGVGLYCLIFKMGAFTSKVYTPQFETLTIAAFMLAFSIFGLKAFAIISRMPIWFADQQWQGAWSYTLGRSILVIAFIVTTCIFSERATYKRIKRHRKQNKQTAP